MDTVPPATVQMHSPVEGQTLRNIFDIVTTIQDSSISSYTLEIGKGNPATSWHQLFTGSAEISNDVMYTVETNNIDTDTIPSMSTIGEITNGAYVLRLTTTDHAGNTTVVERSITIDNIFITDVSVTELIAKPVDSQSAAVEYTVDMNADMTFQVYTQLDGDTDQLIRTINQSVLAGPHTFSWDGKDDPGTSMDTGGYIFVLSAATANSQTDQFKPSPTLNQMSSSPPNQSFNPWSNEWYGISLTMGNIPGRYQVKITPSGEDPFTTYTKYAAAHETFMFYWDGRRPDGTIVDSSVSIFLSDTWSNENLLLVEQSSAPVITGPAATINIQSDPYLVTFCYGEQTSIKYTIDRTAEVTITMFPFGQNALSPDAIVLTDHEIQVAGEYSAVWTGTDSSDIRHILISTEGFYEVVIEATVDNATSIVRGVISLNK